MPAAGGRDGRVRDGGVPVGYRPITAKTGDITAKTGGFAAKTGDITAKTADITAKTADITARTGDITARTGDITAKTGDITARTGDITAKRLRLKIHLEVFAARLRLIAAIPPVLNVDDARPQREAPPHRGDTSGPER